MSSTRTVIRTRSYSTAEGNARPELDELICQNRAKNKADQKAKGTVKKLKVTFNPRNS